jgi:CRISPR-associated protein Cmr1
VIEFPFALEFNSPAFLGGVPRGKKSLSFLRRNRAGQNELTPASPIYYPADPRGIRIPSLRGVLEFWHRASLGGAATSREVFDQQAQVFGSADGGQGLTIRPAGLPRFDRGEISFGRNEEPFPFLYLGYGPLQLVRLPRWAGDMEGGPVATTFNKDHARDAIKVVDGQRGRFRFVARGTEGQIKALRQALTLLHLFGGLGARSRRGWGSIEVTAEGLQPPGNGPLADWVASTLAGVWSASRYPAGKGDPSFSALSPVTRICVTQPIDDDYRGVLRSFYECFREVRSYRDGKRLGVDDHTLEVRDFGLPPASSITGVPARLAFGMPYQPVGKNKDWSIEYRGRLPGPGAHPEEVSRRASPLLLKVIRLGPRSHAGIALFLQAQFFGDSKLRIGAKGKDLTQPFPGYGAIHNFLSGPGWIQVPLPP